MRKLIYGFILYGILLLPPVIALLEKWMLTHMLVQMVLLIVVGVLIGEWVTNKWKTFFSKWNKFGIPGIMLVFIITMYWMVPRTMDEALQGGAVEVFKFISLPFLVGLVLYDSWRKLTPLVKGIVIFNYIPMFGMMAWLYIDSPIQICNNYLETEQKMLGWGFFMIMSVLLLYIIQSVFTDTNVAVHDN